MIEPPILPQVRFGERKIIFESGLEATDREIFHGYCDLAGRRYVSARRVRNHDSRNSTVTLNGLDLDFGEDPRIFVHNGCISIVSAVYTDGHGFRNHLYEWDKNGFRRSMLVIAAPIAVGKNWSPFTFPDGKLGFIHSFDPLVILRELRRENGIVVLSAHRSGETPRELGPGGYSVFRGGTNGINFRSYIVGIGHTTRFRPGTTTSDAETLGFEHLYHRPFGWMLNPKNFQVVRFGIEGPFPERYDVIDPTSLIPRTDGSFDLFTTEVERHFSDVHSHRAVAAYRFELPPQFTQAAVGELSLTRLSWDRFFSTNGGTPTDEGLAVPLAGVAGHVIYGPYIGLPMGRYELQFSFDCSGATGVSSNLVIEAVANQNIILVQRTLSGISRDRSPAMIFTINRPDSVLEFRIAADGFQTGFLKFKGAVLKDLDTC